RNPTMDHRYRARYVLLAGLAADHGVRSRARDHWNVGDSVYQQEYPAAVARGPGKPRILGAPGDHVIYDRHAYLCRVDDGVGSAAGADRAGLGFCANAQTRRVDRA